jgi:hypothetical protein
VTDHSWLKDLSNDQLKFVTALSQIIQASVSTNFTVEEVANEIRYELEKRAHRRHTNGNGHGTVKDWLVSRKREYKKRVV